MGRKYRTQTRLKKKAAYNKRKKERLAETVKALAKAKPAGKA
jgi:hypothetical protein